MVYALKEVSCFRTPTRRHAHTQMFTGIIEETGTVTQIDDLGGGKRLTIEAEMAPALQVDQSVSINGACQTVVDVEIGRAHV